MDRPSQSGGLTGAAQDHLPTLVGERVSLRWLEPRDVPDLFGVFADPDVMRYWSRGVFREQSEAESLLAEVRRLFTRRELFQWGVVRRADDRVIGTCTLHHLELPHRRAELGYALGRDSWGQGLMTEALGLLLQLAFEGWGLHRIEADTDPRNERSLRVLERLGFRREGLLRERFMVGAELQNSVFLGLLRRDFETALPDRARRDDPGFQWFPFPSPAVVTSEPGS